VGRIERVAQRSARAQHRRDPGHVDRCQRALSHRSAARLRGRHVGRRARRLQYRAGHQDHRRRHRIERGYAGRNAPESALFAVFATTPAPRISTISKCGCSIARSPRRIIWRSLKAATPGFRAISRPKPSSGWEVQAMKTRRRAADNALLDAASQRTPGPRRGRDQ